MKRLLPLLIVLVCGTSFSQIKDIGGLDYTYAFNKSGSPDFARSRIWLNYPVKLKKKDHILVNGLRYSNIKLDFDTNATYNFDTGPLREIHVLEYTLGYTFLINEKWRFTAQVSPTVASNLEAKISGDDLTWSGGVLFIKTNETPKKTRWTLGLVYNQRTGIPLPLPFATYFREVNDHVAYTLGVPISKIKYFFGERKYSFESFVTLDGYFSNISLNLAVGDQIAENISLSGVVTGLGFDKYIGKRMNLFIKGGYTLGNSLRLVKSRNDEIFNFDLSNTFIFRGGLKFNF